MQANSAFLLLLRRAQALIHISRMVGQACTFASPVGHTCIFKPQPLVHFCILGSGKRPGTQHTGTADRQKSYPFEVPWQRWRTHSGVSKLGAERKARLGVG
jgi:hypothetical protein